MYAMASPTGRRKTLSDVFGSAYSIAFLRIMEKNPEKIRTKIIFLSIISWHNRLPGTPIKTFIPVKIYFINFFSYESGTKS